MGRQIGFYGLWDDLNEVLGLQAIPSRIGSEEVPRPAPPTEFVLPNGHFFFFLIPSDVQVSRSIYRVVPGKDAFIDGSALPSIEVSPTIMAGRTLERPGRIYVEMSDKDARGKYINRIFDTLARRMRKWQLLKTQKLYIGPAALAEVRNGAVRVEYFGKPITPGYVE
jgi:hypothetical protein